MQHKQNDAYTKYCWLGLLLSMAFRPKAWFDMRWLLNRNGTFRFDLTSATLMSEERYDAGRMDGG
jgi:hypothetical protein